jgi:N-methylhydantoinase A/oxoprolinase/acetone carboxylase beta subunit
VPELQEFTNFLYGFGALRKLIYKANKDGALIEGIVTYAALVDGFLRIGLILKRQLINKNEDIDLALISQTSSTQYLSERKVFKLALTESVIEPSLFSEISGLYERRNEIVHRFLLTPQTYAQIPPTLERYEVVYKKLTAIVRMLEEAQVQSKVGMTRASHVSPEHEQNVLKEIVKKIILSEAK